MSRRYIDIQKLVQGVNDRNQVKLRLRKGKDRYAVYYDFFAKDPNGKSKRVKGRIAHLKFFGDREHCHEDAETLREVEVFIQILEKRLFSQASGVPLPKEDRAIDFLAFARNEYDKRCEKAKNQGIKPDRNYRITIEKVEAFLGGKKLLNIHSIDNKFCSDFRDYLCGLKITNNTAHHYFGAFKAFLGQAVQKGHLQYNPANGIKIKFPEPKKDFLTQEELQALNDSNIEYTQIRNAFLFACYTGLRKGDILNLQVKDVNGDTIQVIQKKTGKMVSIPIAETARKIIENHMQYLSSQKTGVSLSPDSKFFSLPSNSRLGKRLQAWAESAGVEKKVTYHTSRHTFGTLLVKSGVDIYRVKELMGHRDVRTTQVYAKLSHEDLQKSVEKLPVL